jgi:3-dehydroquinate synthase
MKSIESGSYSIHFNEQCYVKLNSFLEHSNFSKIFILVDTNTHDNCLPEFLSNISYSSEFEIIEMEAGELHKTLETCTQVWHALSELGADRKSLLINLGGGVVTDLGGFVASAFKRGIRFINVPTSLLAMVDASVGGKTGVDLGSLKNQVGVINFSEMVLIDTSFLKTLSKAEMRSGMAEMLKHGLIKDANYWSRLCDLTKLNSEDLDGLIHESVIIKNEVVKRDPNEQGERKQLNFGHTLGHAIESYCLENEKKTTLLHGEAIAAGMILEAYLSTKTCGLSNSELSEIKKTFKDTYGSVEFNEKDKTSIIELLKYDKKNSHGLVKYALLEKIGVSKVDVVVTDTMVHEAFSYYAS